MEKLSLLSREATTDQKVNKVYQVGPEKCCIFNSSIFPLCWFFSLLRWIMKGTIKHAGEEFLFIDPWSILFDIGLLFVFFGF